MSEVGYFEPGREREAMERFAAVASERRWTGTEGLLDIEARTPGLVGAARISRVQTARSGTRSAAN